MEWITLANRLGVPRDAIEGAKQVRLSEAEESALREVFEEGWRPFNEAVGRYPNAELVVLRLYLQWAVEVWPEYERKGIPAEIYLGTLKDIPIWCRFYAAANGKPGLTEWGWCARGIRMDLFRIGRLQYELRKLHMEVELDGVIYPEGTEIIGIHIPAEDPLDPVELEKSFEQAKAFFKKQFGGDYPLFYTHTWLLSPALKELLPPDSRILKFQSCFKIFGADESKQAEERVFGKVLEDPADYPENTSLQRALKRHLLAGKTVPMSCGIRKAN